MIYYRGEIAGRPIVKKNTAKHYRGKRVYSAKFRNWEAVALLSLRGLEKPIDWYCEAVFEFHFKNRQGEADTSNLIEGIQDVLQTKGVITDDKFIKRVVAEKFFDGQEKTTVILREL